MHIGIRDEIYPQIEFMLPKEREYAIRFFEHLYEWDGLTDAGREHVAECIVYMREIPRTC